MELWVAAATLCNNRTRTHKQLCRRPIDRLSGVWSQFELDSNYSQQPADCITIRWELAALDVAQGQFSSLFNDIRFSAVLTADGRADNLFELERETVGQERPL
jgi:hypothetical protein